MEEVYSEHSKAVYRYLLSLTHDPQLAEELTQETFYQAVKSAGRFDGSCKVTTWLCAIAKNALSGYRRKNPPADLLDATAAFAASPEADALAKAGQLELFKKLRLQSADAREVMYLRLLGGLSFQEIGEILGRTENWARVTFYRGKEKLKRELDPDGKQA